MFTASLRFVCVAPPLSLTPTLPPLSLFLYASAADCLRLLCFRFGNRPVLFIYAYLKVMPSRLGLPCLALACLALAVLGLLKPSASLVCRLCHETLAPDGAEQNSWHWSWPEGAEHGPQPEYFISALCYSLCAHITQTRLNFCNFSLHSHKHTQIHFNVNPFSKDFPAEARSFPFPDCLSVSIISHSGSRSACIFSLLMPHGWRCRHRNTHKPSQASQVEPAKQTLDQTEALN